MGVGILLAKFERSMGDESGDILGLDEMGSLFPALRDPGGLTIVPMPLYTSLGYGALPYTSLSAPSTATGHKADQRKPPSRAGSKRSRTAAAAETNSYYDSAIDAIDPDTAGLAELPVHSSATPKVFACLEEGCGKVMCSFVSGAETGCQHTFLVAGLRKAQGPREPPHVGTSQREKILVSSLDVTPPFVRCF